jgi:CDP-diacylglycerol--glycerol-3-phosphate 3-phosphatidyltransferase
MPTVYDLKPRFQSLLRPLVVRMSTAGVTANQVTLTATCLSLITGAAIAFAPASPWPLLSLPLVLLIRMGLNAVDGMLAREFGQASRLGALLNEVGDVVSDIALYLPLALVPGIPAVPLVLFTLVAAITEFAGVAAIQVGSPRRYDGPMGKSDRAFWISMLALLAAAGWLAGVWVQVCCWVLVAFSVLTVINRCRGALAKPNDFPGPEPTDFREPQACLPSRANLS